MTSRLSLLFFFIYFRKVWFAHMCLIYVVELLKMCCHSPETVFRIKINKFLKKDKLSGNVIGSPLLHPSSLWWFALLLIFSQTHIITLGLPSGKPREAPRFSICATLISLLRKVREPGDLRNSWHCLALFLYFILCLITVSVPHLDCSALNSCYLLGSLIPC